MTRSDLANYIIATGDDEFRVIRAIAARLQKGAREYGGLNIDNDRDWGRELREELLDAIVYATVLELRNE